ncbi:PREDICTED: eukaryotic translation initiation factor 2A [Polistes dominula]|uniref:Eukaryotic translation initiation factor 2A n=1 Tax=Polistes dominula TaxID=743375 RepID=A0ABM1JA88_POLDO|nr:PREDICTED: eukaryotic translation initiation factor 2A [Polistes dominula]
MFDIMIPHGNGGKMALTVPCVAVRGSTGISLGQGPPSYEPVTTFPKDDSKLCRVMLFSPDGRYFAWTNGTCVKIVLCNTWKVITEIKKPKVSAIRFSSKGTYFMTWEPYTATLNNPQRSPNLHIWKTETNELVKSFVQKKQSDWEPQWSSDEKICGILMGADVMFYEDANFEKIVHRINIATVAKFSIAPNNAPYHILCYVPGKSGQPSLGRLFQYPKFQSTQALANKSFFQADRVDIYWNQKGTSALLMTSTEMDKSSYYGKQTLHYLNTKSETAMVMFSKEGPIYSVQWSPKNTEFCVVYGFMPAKATLFNLKCEPIFEFGALHRNSIYYNPHGNILILAGFGNLSGIIQLWDVVNRKLIAEISASDTTLLEWSPDGEHFMTATTTPRLRMGNGFKIWHYSGTLLYERPWNKQEELWEVLWQTFPPDTFKEKPISYKAVEGIAPSQPQASKQVYRPPSARGQTITFKLHDDEEFGIKPTTDSNPSKAALKAKKKREAKKAKKELELQTNVNSTSSGVLSHPSNPTTNGQVSNNSSKIQSNAVTSDSDLTEDPEKQKKIKKLKNKLDQISKLKEQLSAGKQLEINQLEKIKKEAELVKELEELIL